MKFFDLLFGKKDIKTAETDSSVKIQENINAAISQTKKDIQSERSKITEIEKSAKELIADIYYVISKYWYDELKYFDEIKKHPENKNMDTSITDKTENLLKDYKEEMKLCESKINFLNTILLKYERSLEKIETVIHKALTIKNKSDYLEAIEKYKGKLDDAVKDNEDLSKIYEDSEYLKRIDEELEEIEEDFLIKKEVNEYIHKITSDYDIENMNTKILREEINKLKDSLNKSDEHAE